MTTEPMDDKIAGAWNPDIRSTLPAKYLPLSTMFRPENVFTSIEAANELSGFTGLQIQELICFRPQRLVVHELLVRVSADIFVSDGSKYEDLGVNFRRVVTRILQGYIEPHMSEVVDRFDRLRRQGEAMITAELEACLFPSAASAKTRREGFSLSRLFRAKPAKPVPAAGESVEQRHQHILDGWRQQANAAGDELSAAAYASLATIANALIIKHGRIIGDKTLLISLASGLVCNRYGSEVIGELIAPYVREAAEQEGYRVLPAQSEPVVINVKGASASGKSTMRPLQKIHVERLGLNWQDFALISPDIWRKYLLDYDTLGVAYKYAGTLAGDEIPIVDKKLDHYIGAKAAAGKISHLLIDRFRFDSFAPGRDTEEGSNLLTRFGHTVYLIFMVTPPPATVERAWLRGLQVGRYKAVDDLLDHNVEAFKGIPVLFFTWALRKDKTVYYEFLDNSVSHKQTPRTIAFGLNREMYVIDFKCMLDIVRYTRININAENPDEVYPSAADMEPQANTDFLVRCARKIPVINFVDRVSGQVYACMESGKMRWVDRDLLERIVADSEAQAALVAMSPRLLEDLEKIPREQARPIPDDALRHTLGDMG
ncbi:MAG: hypothetical protein OEN02_13500 [Gammaproteobacteria bacterium]|nr:hypothetical protein [Gammaproteobacteria bacterium]